MITIEKLKIYYKYHGDGDMWNRLETSEEAKIIQYSDWKLIEDIVQDIIFIENNVVSLNYKNEVLSKASKNCSDKETLEYLIKVANDIK